ncbi:MAG: LamG-like jellyroll fold domain-containing protein [Bacteroidota bacterium]
MKKLFFTFTCCIIVVASGVAQLANWTDGGFTNFPINNSGQINGFCRIPQLKFHATSPDKLYAVTAEGGFFTSDDAGLNWTVKAGTENLTGSCASLCIDYTNDQVIYLGTGDPNYYGNGQGILKSTNGGTSFSATTLTNCLVMEMLQDPATPTTFVAATNKGIYKSIDNAVTWAAVTATNIPFCDLKENAAPNSPILYSCTHENTPRFYRSTDFGSTWTQVTAGITASTTFITGGAKIGVTPADPDVVYLEVIGGGAIIHKSVDGGLSFTVKKGEGTGTMANPYLTFYDYNNNNGLAGQGLYNNTIWVDVANPSKLWLQSHNNWVSTDDGVTWTELTHWSTKLHTDMHQVQQSPHDATKLYSCNDGGVWVSTDGGLNWVTRSNGLYAYEIANNAGKTSHTNRDYAIIGTQDNGKLCRRANGWFTIGGGDDYEPKEYDYQPNGGYFYNKNNNTRTVAPGGPSSTYGLPTLKWQAMSFNRTNTNLGFMDSMDVYRTTNLSATTPAWVKISSFNKTILASHSCVADANRLYVIANDQKIYVSTDALSASPSFTPYNLPTASNSIASIAAIAGNANTVYISINSKVYVSVNGGANWTDITYNLPNVGHRKILSEDYGGTEELVFIATNNAVYYKKSGQTTWTNYSTNLPGRRAPTDFSMYDDGTSQSLIRYSSYGRGMWETPFGNLRALSAHFVTNGDSNLTCANPSIQFADASVGTTHTPVAYAWSFPGGTPASSSSATQNVTYATTGVYSATLTITDALNNSSTKTITKNIQVISCTPDTIPGSAISIAGAGNYATTPALAMGSTNTVTLSTWLKIGATQSSFAGVLFTGDGSGCGINFRNNNQIGYTWNNVAGTYNYSGGPTIPNNEWTHVALVITATNATIYVNGVPYTNNVANTATNFANGFNLGNDRNNTSRSMTGLLDEVCIYNRALTQAEIRELMNITKNLATTDPSLKAYYQCNETGSTVYDRANSLNGSLLGTATHVTSTAPVGGGVAQTINVTTGGLRDFFIPGVEIIFPATGPYPNGEVVVTRLNVPSDQPASASVLPVAPSSYYIIRNYGTNASFSALTSLKFKGVQGVTDAMVNIPNSLKLYKRASNADGATWGSSIDDADVVVNGTTESVEFSAGLANTSFSQFSIGLDAVILPVQLLSFNAVVNNQKSVTLNWKIALESGVKQYEVERSADGIRFTRLGVVAAVGRSSYELTDNLPAHGANYYRLKMTDLSGAFTYSPVRKIDFVSKAMLVIKANPARGKMFSFKILGIKNNLSLALVINNASGAEVKTATIKNVTNDASYEVKLDQPGVYFIKIILSDGQTMVKEVLVLD